MKNNPYIGILFSEDLKWTDHITKITKKANSTLGFLRRNLYCPIKCKRAAYLSMVRSVLEYGATLWDPYLQKEINMLEQVQRKALRFIAGDFKSTQPGTIRRLHAKLNIPTLQERRKAIRLTFMYKVVEGLVPAMPHQNFIELQKTKRQIRSRRDPNFDYKNNTIDRFIRNNDKCIVIKSANSEQFKNSFFIRTAVDWNQLDNSVIQAKTPDSFKTILNKQLNIRD